MIKKKEQENQKMRTADFKRVNKRFKRSVCPTANQSLLRCIRESNVILCSLHHQEDLPCSRQRICVVFFYCSLLGKKQQDIRHLLRTQSQDEIAV